MLNNIIIYLKNTLHCQWVRSTRSSFSQVHHIIHIKDKSCIFSPQDYISFSFHSKCHRTCTVRGHNFLILNFYLLCQNRQGVTIVAYTTLPQFMALEAHHKICPPVTNFRFITSRKRTHGRSTQESQEKTAWRT